MLAALRSREWRASLVVMLVVEVLAIIVVSTVENHDHIDAEVYQLGVRAWMQGQDLYGPLPPTESGFQLPFIYPPFAVGLLAPLAFVPKTVAVAAVLLASHAALLLSLYIIVGSSRYLAPHRKHVLLATAGILPFATIAEPVMETFAYAQVSLVLMVAVVVDCLWRTDGERRMPWPRGILIGVATGLKLTSAPFLLFLLLRKDYRAIAWSAVSFAATLLIGLAFGVGNSIQFWTHEVFKIGTTSFGNQSSGSIQFSDNVSTFAGNLSLHSVLAKFHLTGAGLTAAWALCCVVVVGLAVLGMLQALREHNLTLAVMINAIAGLLVSTLSWSHHWVWAMPTLALLIGMAVAKRQVALLVPTAFAAAVFIFGPQWTLPAGSGKELTWTFFQQLLANAYVYFGIAFIAYTAYLWWQARRDRQQVADSPREPEPTESVSTSS